MKEPDFLTLSDVGLTFADTNVEVLSGIDLKVSAGSFTAVVGRSGVGKSTLLRIIGGLLSPSRGEVRLRGSDPHTSSAAIGIVFQRDNLMPWRTVSENVGLPLEVRKGDLETGRLGDSSVSQSPSGLVSSSLALVGLAEHGENYPAQLSGGMAQRVALARALVHRPELLLLDEPFGALDALTRERMAEELLRIWQARPVTVLMVTHSITEAVLLSDEVLVMNDRPGRITDRIPIDLARPRSMDIEATAQFQRYAKTIRRAIRE